MILEYADTDFIYARHSESGSLIRATLSPLVYGMTTSRHEQPGASLNTPNPEKREPVRSSVLVVHIAFWGLLLPATCTLLPATAAAVIGRN